MKIKNLQIPLRKRHTSYERVQDPQALHSKLCGHQALNESDHTQG